MVFECGEVEILEHAVSPHAIASILYFGCYSCAWEAEELRSSSGVPIKYTLAFVPAICNVSRRTRARGLFRGRSGSWDSCVGLT